jgi:phosphatidylcholine synthase
MPKLKLKRPAKPRPPEERLSRPPASHGRWTIFLAWCVHVYTALGLVAAAAITVLLVSGGPNAFRWSFLLMLVATAIDSTDGTLARRIRIKDVLPGFDGRKLDDLTDFLTYTFLALLLIWRAGILPAGQEGWLLLPLLASAYGFCQVEAKTPDGYFLGFPSLWNVVAFYLYVLRPPGWFSLAVVIVLSVLTFVPTRYLYPSSKPGILNVASNILGGLWTALLVWILWNMPSEGRPESNTAAGSVRWLTLVSLFYPVYYLGASWAVSIRMWLAQRRARIS